MFLEMLDYTLRNWSRFTSFVSHRISSTELTMDDYGGPVCLHCARNAWDARSRTDEVKKMTTHKFRCWLPTRMLDTGEHSDLVLMCADKMPFFDHRLRALKILWESMSTRQLQGMSSIIRNDDWRADLSSGRPGQQSQPHIWRVGNNQTSLNLPVHFRLRQPKPSRDLYSTADFYDIQPLKTVAVAKFNAAAARFWKEEEYFPTTIQKVYATTLASDRGLRDPVIKLAIKHIAQLLKPEIDYSPTFTDVLFNNADLGKDMSWAMLPTATQFTGWVKRRYVQPWCNHGWGDAGMERTAGFVAATSITGGVACPKCRRVYHHKCLIERLEKRGRFSCSIGRNEETCGEAWNLQLSLSTNAYIRTRFQTYNHLKIV